MCEFGETKNMKEIPSEEIKLNPMSLISDKWLLITAGNKTNGFNTMTACWGHLGDMEKDCHQRLFTFVRNATRKNLLTEKSAILYLSSQKRKKKILAYLGTHSGRDVDKTTKSGLTPIFVDDCTYFEEANLVIFCRKIYMSPLIQEGFLDKKIMEENYPEKDFHEMYIGEILRTLTN